MARVVASLISSKWKVPVWSIKELEASGDGSLARDILQEILYLMAEENALFDLKWLSPRVLTYVGVFTPLKQCGLRRERQLVMDKNSKTEKSSNKDLHVFLNPCHERLLTFNGDIGINREKTIEGKPVSISLFR
ncbi:hypothetical protein Tco_0717626 [Tanacetum coccineum]